MNGLHSVFLIPELIPILDNPRTSEVTLKEIQQLSAEIHQTLQCPITVTSTVQPADPAIEQARYDVIVMHLHTHTHTHTHVKYTGDKPYTP